MALAPRLDLRQSQQLVMTPQLQQAIRLLQFNNLELSAFLAEEIEKNPLLELASPDSDGDGGPDAEAPEAPTEAAMGAESAATESLEGGADVSAGNDAPLDADYDLNVFNNDAAPDRSESLAGLAGERSRSGDLPDGDLLEQTVEETMTLRDHVTADLPLLLEDPAERMIGAHLIDLLDDSGYLQAGWEEIAERLGCEPADVERVIAVLQTVDPPGLFARSLKECLALQLREQDRLDPCMEALLQNLDMVAKHDMAGLRRKCGVDAEDLADMIAELRTLNPRPGNVFGGEAMQPVTPDVFVRKGPGGIYQVVLNPDTLPRLLVNNSYAAELDRRAGSKAEKSYLAECLSGANWLARALDQRARTILKVSIELVNHQIGFFEDGVAHLKPLTLKTIADAIDMHESTVSRVTSNKYVACDRGIFDMKFFFTTAIQSAEGGDAHAAEAVRHRLKILIDAETPDDILSDDDLVTLLKKDGIDIARRTVAKYREAMGIESSVQRRRLKRLAAAS